MNVLFICDTRPHAHDYGVDFLIQGAYALLGAKHVFEWPEKPNLHLSVISGRDECQIDSDAWLPAKGLNAQELAGQVAAGKFDVVILTMCYGTAQPWREVCSALPERVPVIGLHYDDQPVDTRQQLEAIVGRSLVAYYHREQCPEHGKQLWLSQPVGRVRSAENKPNLRPVFFAGALHSTGIDFPRDTLVCSIREAVPSADIILTTDQQVGKRLSPEVYRDRLWESAVSVVWTSSADFDCFDSNRLWESLALGCAVVCERPRRTMPHLEGVTWIDRPEDAGPAVASILNEDNKRLRYRQQLAQYSFRWWHTSEVVLTGMLEMVGVLR